MPSPNKSDQSRLLCRLLGVRVALLLPILVLVCVQTSFAQELPGGTGLPIGEGARPAEAPRAGRQGWTTEATFATLATLTNNANYGTSEVRAGDLVLEFIPGLSFKREGRRLRVNGSVALDMIGYIDGTQVNRILPRADITANLEAIDDLFFVDASLFADQLVENPYLPGSGFASTNNLYTAAQVRLVPYLKGNIGQNVRWKVSSDNSYTWTSQTDDPLGNAYYVRNLAEIVREPTPFGVTLRLTNDLTRVKDQVQEDQTLSVALALFDYAMSPQLRLGLRGGYERTNYTLQETAGPIYGASVGWRPSPATSLEGYWEERFYGPSYQVDFSHRQRQLASTASFYRTITTFSQVLFQIPPSSSVSGLLDAILVARFPDPLDRSRQVQDLVTRQGLPQALPAGTNIYNQSANVLTGGDVGWALIGPRNTIALNLFYLKTELLPDARVPPTFLEFNNNIQQGAGVTLSHRLSPITTFNGTVSTSYTRGFDANEGLKSRENLVNAQFNRLVSPRSTVFIGARYQIQTSTSAALSETESSEFAVFVGLFHRL